MESSVLLGFLCLFFHSQQETEAQFNRACESYEDCFFLNETLEASSPFNDPSVNFACDTTTGSCSCRSAVVLSDNKPLWDLSYIPSRETPGHGECYIGPNGPCGIDRGLRIHCTGGEFKCIQGRCRQETQLHKLKEGTLCHDSVECQGPLTCQMTLWHFFYTESKCLPPTNQVVNNSNRDHALL